MTNLNKETLKPPKKPKRKFPQERIGMQSLDLSGRKAGLVLCSIILASLAVMAVGVHIGANGEDRAYTGMVLWIADLLQSM